MESMLTLSVNSTHFYRVDLRPGWLLVDAGWSMAQFTAQLKRCQVSFSAIKYVLFTHHHPSHANPFAAAQILEQLCLACPK